MSLRILACGVFRDALRHLRLPGHHPGLQVTYLPPSLHNQPRELKKELSRQIHLARKEGESILCMYGQCFPEMDDFLQQQRIPRQAGAHCYEMLLGSKPFRRVMEEDAGTYFLEKELILHFSEYCLQPLELHDPQMRQWCFQHYRKILYIRQPLDPDLVPRARDLAHFLALHLTVMDADYSELKANLLKLIQGSRSPQDSVPKFLGNYLNNEKAEKAQKGEKKAALSDPPLGEGKKEKIRLVERVARGYMA